MSVTLSNSHKLDKAIKIHYLFKHIDRFSYNLPDLSEEEGGRFEEDIMEGRSEGGWAAHMVADYCWSLQTDLFIHPSRRRQNLSLQSVQTLLIFCNRACKYFNEIFLSFKITQIRSMLRF